MLSRISTVDYINIIMTESSEMSVRRSGPLPVIQTFVTKSVTDSEIISLDAKLHREITATNKVKTQLYWINVGTKHNIKLCTGFVPSVAAVKVQCYIYLKV